MGGKTGVKFSFGRSGLIWTGWVGWLEGIFSVGRGRAALWAVLVCLLDLNSGRSLLLLGAWTLPLACRWVLVEVLAGEVFLPFFWSAILTGLKEGSLLVGS